MFSLFEKYFLAVAQTGSFTRAAKQLYVSQPAVSRQILLVEKQLGLPLFTRSTGSVALTPQGKIIYNAIKNKYDAVFEAQQIKTNLSGSVRIALLNGWSVNQLPTSAFSSFSYKYPQVEMIIEFLTYDEMNYRLSKGSLDLIFTNKSELEQSSYTQFFHAFKVPLYFILSTAHPLAKTANNPAELGNMNLYIMNQDVSKFSISFVSQMIDKNGWRLNIVPYPNFESIMHAVNNCRGCAMGCSSSYTNELDRYKNFETGWSMDTICAWNSNLLSQATQAFLAEFNLLEDDFKVLPELICF